MGRLGHTRAAGAEEGRARSGRSRWRARLRRCPHQHGVGCRRCPLDGDAIRPAQMAWPDASMIAVRTLSTAAEWSKGQGVRIPRHRRGTAAARRGPHIQHPRHAPGREGAHRACRGVIRSVRHGPITQWFPWASPPEFARGGAGQRRPAETPDLGLGRWQVAVVTAATATKGAVDTPLDSAFRGGEWGDRHSAARMARKPVVRRTRAPGELMAEERRPRLRVPRRGPAVVRLPGPGAPVRPRGLWMFHEASKARRAPLGPRRVRHVGRPGLRVRHPLCPAALPCG